jgi:hypothetical protein
MVNETHPENVASEKGIAVASPVMIVTLPQLMRERKDSARPGSASIAVRR